MTDRSLPSQSVPSDDLVNNPVEDSQTTSRRQRRQSIRFPIRTNQIKPNQTKPNLTQSKMSGSAASAASTVVGAVTSAVAAATGSANRWDISSALQAGVDSTLANFTPDGSMSRSETEGMWDKIFAQLRITNGNIQQQFIAAFATHVLLTSTSTQQEFNFVITAAGVPYQAAKFINSNVLPPNMYRRFWASEMNMQYVDEVSQSMAVKKKLAEKARQKDVRGLGVDRTTFDLCSRLPSLTEAERAEIKRTVNNRLENSDGVVAAASASQSAPSTLTGPSRAPAPTPFGLGFS